MRGNNLVLPIGAIAALSLVLVLSFVSTSHAGGLQDTGTTVPIALIDTAAVFFIFVFGVRVVSLTRGGFLSIAFTLIIAGIMIGWVAKLGLEFLTNSSILVTTYDIVNIAEAIGGIILVIGFALLSKKLKS